MEQSYWVFDEGDANLQISVKYGISAALYSSFLTVIILSAAPVKHTDNDEMLPQVD